MVKPYINHQPGYIPPHISPWFQPAGRYREATEALTSIEGIAVGRADRQRIEKDVQARRGLAVTMIVHHYPLVN